MMDLLRQIFSGLIGSRVESLPLHHIETRKWMFIGLKLFPEV